MKTLKLVFCGIYILALVVLCRQIITNSISNQNNKTDYAELNHVKYGIFNIDEWKRQLTLIVAAEINKLDLSKTNERVLRKHIEALMSVLIDTVDKKIREGNESKTGGWVAQAFINTFVSLEDIKKGIPEYTDAVIKEMTKKKTKREIKAMLRQQLDEYAGQTFREENLFPINRILVTTDSRDIKAARGKLGRAISARNDELFAEAVLLIVLAAGLFALTGFHKQRLEPSRYFLLVFTLLILLTAGVTTPMIDMEAKIAEMRFALMGHTVSFDNQVLYFQSKSILDVFWIMITHKDMEMKFVGVLMVTFSIVFPLLKIASSLGYYYNYRRARENPAIKFLILKSGKWSMADVMVIAIFMAYIGFNGIITSQFGQISTVSQELVLVTTNGTCLQPGYYLFLTYTLLALFLSGFLAKTPQARPIVNGTSEV